MSGHNWQPDADWIQKHEPDLDFQKCSECAMVRCWAGDGRFRYWQGSPLNYSSRAHGPTFDLEPVCPSAQRTVAR